MFLKESNSGIENSKKQKVDDFPVWSSAEHFQVYLTAKKPLGLKPPSMS